VSFHAYGPRVCVLKFCVGELKCECFSVYFPTSWDTDVEVEGIYETLQVLLDNCRANGAIPTIGGDFNASIGSLLDGEDDDLLRSGVLVNGVDAEDGLYNGFCPMDCVWRAVKELLTRRRVGLAEGSVTECLCTLILFFSDDRISVESNWNDFMLLLGIDHRCVYCRLRFALAGRANNYNNMS